MKPQQKRFRRWAAIKQGQALWLQYGIDAHEMIINLVLNEYPDLLDGCEDEDERWDYCKGVADFVEWLAGGSGRP